MEKYVKEFVEYAEKNKLPIEAILLSNKDGIIYEHYFKDLLVRNIYSHTKTFLSVTAGIAMDEGIIDLDTRFVDLFHDELTEKQIKDHKDLTLKHFLTMSSGIGNGLLFQITRGSGEAFPDYFEYLMNYKIENEPGKKFVYSNADTYLASLMISKVTGKKIQEYMYEKLFEPLSIKYPAMECDPKGNAFCASGLFLNIVDMNKIGRLVLNKGKFGGKQVVSEKFINLLNTKMIKTNIVEVEGSSKVGFNDDYGLQVWFQPHGFRADGAYGQITLIYPDDNLCLSVQMPEIGTDFDNVFKVIRSMILDKYFAN